MVILLTATGTGGHILPAKLIAEAILEQAGKERTEIHFVGTGRELERKILAGFNLHIIKSMPLKGMSLSSLLRFILFTPIAAVKTYFLLRRLKVEAVIGVGGYGSVLPVLIAKLMGKKTWIHEADTHSGLANRLLSYFADGASVAFESAKLNVKLKIHTGQPLRKDILAVKPLSEVKRPTKILVLGGSLGARALDEALADVAELLATKGSEVKHQCRAESVQFLETAYNKAGVKHAVLTFIDDIAAAYDWSELVIARSGAGLVLELEAVARPCILVPLPAADDEISGHQYLNAKLLAGKGQAVIVKEGGGDFKIRFRQALEMVLEKDFEEMRAAGAASEKITENPGKSTSKNAAETIAKEVLKLGF